MKGKNQLLVGMSGSFENLTVVQAKDGDSIVKGKIVQTTNPNSEGQQKQRGNFSIAVGIGRSLIAFIRLYFWSTNVMRSNYNEFVQHNLLTSPATTKWVKKKADAWFDFTKGQTYNLNAVESGTTPPVLNPTDAVITLEWPYDAASQIQNGTDEIRYMIVNDTTDDYSEGSTGGTRNDQEAEFVVPKPAEGLNYLVPFAVDVSTGEPSTNNAVCSVASDGTIVWRANFPPIDQE